MPSSVHEYREYRIAIYSPLWHYAVVTPPGSNRVIEFGNDVPTASVVEGPDVCLARARAVVDQLVETAQHNGAQGLSPFG